MNESKYTYLILSLWQLQQLLPRLSVVLLLTIAGSLLCACSNEIGTCEEGSGGEEGGLTTVILSVNPAGNVQPLTTKGMTTDQEKTIHNLYILAFQPDEAGAYRLKYYATGKPTTGGNFSFSLRCSVSGADDTKLLLIANFNPFPLVNTDITYEGVQAALTSGELVAAPAFADIGIPMFGFAGNNPNTPLKITNGMQLTANLLRAVARVDVGVGVFQDLTGTWNNSGVGFDLTEVYVYNIPNKYALLPEIIKLKYDNYGMPSVTAPSPVAKAGSTQFTYKENAITGAAYCKAEIYIPEVAFNGGKVNDGNHDKRTALVVGGMYNGVKNYYRIDFTTAPTNVGTPSLEDVWRNHIYRYTITKVTTPGYTTPGDAYAGKQVGLNFTAAITDWQTGLTASITPYMYVRMDYGQQNGSITEIPGGAGTVNKKGPSWINNDNRVMTGMNFDYNTWQGEAIDNLFTGTGNGGYYSTAQNAFDREGPFPKLIIAADNAGSSTWKSTSGDGKRILGAKQLCRNYRGQGHSDWRLPRLSELYLLWLNREAINDSKGFTSLGTHSASDIYWSATEYDKDNVYYIKADGIVAYSPKATSYKVRCVREINE